MSADIRNIKSIFIVAILLFFTTSSYSYDDFDECGLLLIDINKNFQKLSLDEPSLEDIDVYYLKHQIKGVALKKYGKDPLSFDLKTIPYQRTKENYVVVEQVAVESHLKDQNFKANAVIYSYGGIKTSEMNDLEITAEYNKSEKFSIIDLKNGEIFKYDLEGNGLVSSKQIYVHLKPLTISNINTLTGSFRSSYAFTMYWESHKLNTLAERIYQKAINHDKENAGHWFFCDYSKKQLNNLYDPDLNLKNKTQDGEGTSTRYVLSHYPKDGDEPSFVTMQKTITSSSEFQVHFDFRTFPFDKQYLKFEIENKDTYIDVSLDYSYTLPMQIQDFTSLQLMEWKKDDIDINYNTVKDLYHGGLLDNLEIIVVVERHFDYFIFKIILPIFLILILSWSTFWICAREIESRLTVSVVCFLSLIAYTFVIDESLPKLSYLTILDVIILLAYVFSAIPTFQSIYSFKLLEENNIEIVNKFDNKFKKLMPIIFITLVILFFSSFVSESSNTISALSF